MGSPGSAMTAEVLHKPVSSQLGPQGVETLPFPPMKLEQMLNPPKKRGRDAGTDGYVLKVLPKVICNSYQSAFMIGLYTDSRGATLTILGKRDAS